MEQKIKCYNCQELRCNDNSKRWYHGDQDDLVCDECAKQLIHADTAYSGMKVSEI